MTMRPWAVVFGWGAFNVALWSVMFAFHARLWAELLYVASALPLTLFGIGVWVSDHTSHSGVRTLGGNAGTAVPFAFGSALIGVGAIYARWLWLLGIGIVLVSAVQMLRSRPEKLHAPPEELARLPVRTLESPPDDTTEAIKAKEEAEQQRQQANGHVKRTRPATSRTAMAATAATVVGAGAAVRRALRNRGSD